MNVLRCQKLETLKRNKMETNNEVAKSEPHKLPTLAELIGENELRKTDNDFMVLMNQEPPKAWIKQHPLTKGAYLPIERVEYLLSRIFVKWWVEVKQVQCLANSVVCTVRLYVINPFTQSEEWQDGVGASPIQTDKEAGAMDFNRVKSAAVMMAAPAAETYAIKDAAEKFGKLFGKDLNRAENINYNDLITKRWTAE